MLTLLLRPLAVVVFENGKSGFNGEHSCMDGTPTSRLNDWLLRSLDMGKIDLGSSSRSASSLPAVTPLTFKLTDSVKAAIDTSIKAHQDVMAKHDLAVLEYAGYGKDQIKQYKTSPDSYAQLVMGLAYYKMEGKAAPTYESAQTRKYRLGRTEVIRSTTNEALDWYKAMEDPKRSVRPLSPAPRVYVLALDVRLTSAVSFARSTPSASSSSARRPPSTSSSPARRPTVAASTATCSASRRCSRRARSSRRCTRTRRSASRATGSCRPRSSRRRTLTGGATAKVRPLSLFALVAVAAVTDVDSLVPSQSSTRGTASPTRSTTATSGSTSRR